MTQAVQCMVNMKKFALLVIVFFGLYMAGRVMLVWDSPYSDSDARVSVTVPQGASLKTISKLLSEKEVLSDPWVFRQFVRKKGMANKLQAGDYVLQQNLTYGELVAQLQAGKGKEVKITIPEGYTISQIDALLAKKNLIKPGEFKTCTMSCEFAFDVESLEGYMYPSTYYENPETFSEKAFVQRLYNTFLSQIASLKTDISASGRTMDEIVNVASMIERESAPGDTDDEMAKISGVIWKRLDEGIALGIDATTRYAKNDWTGPLYTSDFDASKPYDTRRRLGLPPTAISNPSLAAIKAAVSPVETPYYYYLHDKTGAIRWAETYDGHVNNKNLYLR